MSSGTPKGLIIDGHNLLFACYYGMPDRIRSVTGVPIQAVYGFIAAMLKMIRRFEPRSVVVCFDAEEGNFRSALAPSYKSNRVQFEEGSSPFSQLSEIKRGLDFLKVPWLEISGVEADDIMGTVARRLSSSRRVYIASMDHDMYQLIDENTYVFSRARGADTEYGPAEIVAKYGIRPCQFVDYKTLVGDASDNIKGVPGVGAKTAVMLLNAFGDIPGIFANLKYLNPRIATALTESKERIEINKTLITIRTDVDDLLLKGTFSFEHLEDVIELSARTVMQQLGLMAFSGSH